jgi:hypothetical protein
VLSVARRHRKRPGPGGGATGSGRGRGPAAGRFSRFLPAAAGSCSRACAKGRSRSPRTTQAVWARPRARRRAREERTPRPLRPPGPREARCGLGTVRPGPEAGRCPGDGPGQPTRPLTRVRRRAEDSPPRPPPMALTAAVAAAPVARPWTAPARQFLCRGRRYRLAIDLDDQHLAVVFGQGAVAEIDVGGPRQAQDPLLDGRGRRRGPQEHLPEAAGQPEAHPGGQAAEPADDQGAVGVARQAQRGIQGMHAGTAAAARHEEGPAIGDRPATGLECPLGGRIRHAIAARLRPRRQVQPALPRVEEELDQQAAQRSQQPQEGLLEVEEGRRTPITQAETR